MKKEICGPSSDGSGAVRTNKKLLRHSQAYASPAAAELRPTNKTLSLTGIVGGMLDQDFVG